MKKSMPEEKCKYRKSVLSSHRCSYPNGGIWCQPEKCGIRYKQQKITKDE